MAKNREKRLIDGNYTISENVIAYCHLMAHRGHLSRALVKSHDCLGKQCPFFERLNPEYWARLEEAELEKKVNRLLKKQEREEERHRDAFIRSVLEESGCIHVTSIRLEERGALVISYIYDRRVDLSAEIAFLRRQFKRPVWLRARIGTDEAIEQLIRRPRRETRKVTDVRKAPKVGPATKRRLETLGVHCLEDLFGRDGDGLYALDCELSGETVNRRYLTAYRSAVEFANAMELGGGEGQGKFWNPSCIDPTAQRGMLISRSSRL